MSLASTALAEGYSDLRDTAGEAVTFRGVSAVAVINRQPAPVVPGGVDQLDTHEGSTIWLVASLLPKPGEVVTDSFNAVHRIERVKLLGHSYECTCETVR